MGFPLMHFKINLVYIWAVTGLLEASSKNVVMNMANET